MSKRRKNTFDEKLIEALVCSPAIVLGSTKRIRRSAAKKWLAAIKQAIK